MPSVIFVYSILYSSSEFYQRQEKTREPNQGIAGIKRAYSGRYGRRTIWIARSDIPRHRKGELKCHSQIFAFNR